MRKRLTRAEQRDRTRADLVTAADTLFTRQGFHATSVDQVAAEAGYTKGAVYSNFESKEDLFFAVYERRAEATLAQIEATLEREGAREGLDLLTLDTQTRRGRDDAWLAVFIEFWAHVIRHAELRDRFAAIHMRIHPPFTRAIERVAEEQGIDLGADARELTVAMYAMQIGLALERLTSPEEIDETLGARISRGVLGRLLHDEERIG
ncbi:MAG TPA: TetR/AcrR family transcriptional regulator [Thermoleophilaceae bacterium]|nr:TetR/AcrR family transcriptional regulator [Thermoleophilaceae bacterium]